MKLVSGGAIAFGPAGNHWDLKDQEDRGTCVAFAALGALEWKWQAAAGFPDHSEQYLYWSIKHPGSPHDSFPTEDGSSLVDARRALETFGLCDETACSYRGNMVTGDFAHHLPPNGPPDSQVVAAAKAAAPRTTEVFVAKPGQKGLAQKLYDMMRKAGQPVAVILPVFTDPKLTNGANNWQTAMGNDFGLVSDPTSEMQATHAHAVLVTGYRDDVSAGSGAFVFRNSWGASFGARLPDAGNGYHGPGPGFGQISAAFIEEYLYEAWAACRI